MKKYKIEEVTTTTQLENIKDDWEKCQTMTGGINPILSYDWFKCCIECYGRGKDLYILIVRDSSSIQGIAPLWIYSDKIRNINVKRISFIKNPDSPFVDFILCENSRSEILEKLFYHIFKISSLYFDLLCLDEWPSESENLKIFNDLVDKSSYKKITKISSSTPYISITGDWEQFLNSRSRKFRKTRRNINNRMNNLDNFQIRCIGENNSGVINKAIEDISKNSWKAERGIAIISRKEFTNFFLKFTEIAAHKKWLKFWLFSEAGKPVAFEYDLEYNKVIYALRADYDQAYRENSPGAYLEYHTIKYLFDNNYTEYNTGPGLNEYKTHWTESDKKNVDYYICKTFKGRYICLLEGKIYPFFRNIKAIIK